MVYMVIVVIVVHKHKRS